MRDAAHAAHGSAVHHFEETHTGKQNYKGASLPTAQNHSRTLRAVSGINVQTNLLSVTQLMSHDSLHRAGGNHSRKDDTGIVSVLPAGIDGQQIALCLPTSCTSE